MVDPAYWFQNDAMIVFIFIEFLLDSFHMLYLKIYFTDISFWLYGFTLVLYEIVLNSE